MIQDYEKKRIRLNAPLRGYAAGTELPIRVDKDGTPIDRYWRDRLRDAKRDNCVEMVAASKPIETKTYAKKTTTKNTGKEVNTDAN
jgi:hypothetical protein